jgi:hypothetical protein
MPNESSQTSPLHATARDYYRLCSEAERLGVPTSLDDPRSPRTVAGLRRAVEAARGASTEVPARTEVPAPTDGRAGTPTAERRRS